MNFADISLRYRTVVMVLSLVVIVGGYMAYTELGRLEDPAFPIKQAVVITSYPGASASEVAEEVTDAIETAVQQLGQVDYLESKSSAGLSVVDVFIKPHYRAEDLQQIWDELRRKVQAAQAELPPGAGIPFVNDDFGDVYGVLFYVYGEGFGLEEIHDYVKILRRELLLVRDVASVEVMGAPTEAIFVEVPSSRLNRLGAGFGQLISAIEGQSLAADGGDVLSGDRRIRIDPQGGLTSVEAIANLRVVGDNGGTVRLGDFASIARELIEPPGVLLRYNGHPAIAVGVATAAGGNVVTMGDAVQVRLRELQEETPVGIELGVVSMQSDSVRRSVNAFTVNLIEAVLIVLGVLLVAMGLRSGLLIGFILLLTVLGTFIVMRIMAIDLQRISLGALIIALGMLVDNAIVIVEGLQTGMARGMKAADAARAIVGQTTWPLLGATVIAVLAFAPIGLSPDNTGDYCRTLFQVIWISLLLSWVFAITVTPVLGCGFLRSVEAGTETDPYGGLVFGLFRGVLEFCLRFRWATLGLLALLLIASTIGFGNVKQGFFPASSRPQFMVDYWHPQGTDIRAVEADIIKLESWLGQQEGVTVIASSIGAGTLRYELTYGPEKPNPAFAQLIVSVDRVERIDDLLPGIRAYLDAEHPDAMAWPWRMMLGPGGKAKIQARFRGPDPAVLRELAARCEAILAHDPYVTAVRTDWRQRALALQPVLAEPQASRAGITRHNVCQAIETAFSGTRVGLYREKDELIPVLVRSPADERGDPDRLQDALIWSPRAQRPIPLMQVISRIDAGWEDPLMARRDRLPTLTVMCDPAAGEAGALFNRLRPRIEAMSLPSTYSLEWGGEYESTNKANQGLTSLLPVCFGGMILILIMLFNNLRQPLVILLTVPLAIIGVTVGMLIMGAEFGFMPILGVLSLSGMLIKNAIVLNDEINTQIAQGLDRYLAVVQSAVSRARPVAMAALTTVLGMIPLLTDVFFKDMAIAIMFGLTFATILTLVVVPVLYAIVHRVKVPQQKSNLH